MIINLENININNPYLKNKSIDEIKNFITNFLNSDLINNFISSTDNKENNKWEDIDNYLKSLKNIETKSSKRLKRSFKILREEALKNGITDYKKAREEYLNKKYNNI